jgi:dTDP-4-dehydrorhamnose 3,5-epimerase
MLQGVKIFKESIFRDRRGFIWTSWTNKKKYKDLKFNHDKFALSKKNVLRGIHWDTKTWKLISCVYGKIFFVIVDCRPGSTSYLKYSKLILDHKKNESILIPPMFGNAMLCLSDECVLHYKLSYKGTYNDFNKQQSMHWNDLRVKIKWPKKKFILSNRDKT